MKFKVGRLYEVYFTDHSFQCKEPFLCRVPGYVVEDNEEYVQLTCWDTVTDDESARKENFEFICILKANIKKRRLL